MAGTIDKGKITSVDGNVVRVVPCNESGLVSARVVVPWHLRGGSGNLKKGTEVIYAIFEDQTGILLGRADGDWGDYLPGLTVGGKVSAQSAEVSGAISAGSVSSSGAVNAASVAASGSVSGSSVKAGGISLSGHKHSVSEGATETGGPA